MSDRIAGRVTPLLLGAACVGYVTGSALEWGGSRQLSLVMGDFTLGATAAAAAVACLRQGRRRDGRDRAAWLLFALSFTAAALGHVAAPLSLCFAPPAAAGLLLLAKRAVTKAGWVCAVLDAWLVGGSLFTLYRSLAPAEAVQHTALAPARALLDIVLVSMALVLHFRRSGAGRPAVGAAAAALAVIGTGDVLALTPLQDTIWFGGPLLFAHALRDSRRADTAGAPPPPPGVRTGTHPVGTALTALSPYLAAAACALGILWDALDGGSVNRAVLLAGCAVVVALVVRQGIMLLDTIALTQELARREHHFRSLVQSGDAGNTAEPNPGGEGGTGDQPAADAPQEDMVPSGIAGRGDDRGEPGGRVLRFGARLLPAEERAEWLDEQSAILSDLPGRREKWRWTVDQLFAMPRYAYTVRSGRDKESA
ncbi:hypothetical protein ACIPW5_03370 [Streptomyces sp. NPDC090077]|uniref:hypothetical protein n=1 Tax=Streptomyces sp. NPDC090077 TaxID=3365938 RepID=UPI0038219ABF